MGLRRYIEKDGRPRRSGRGISLMASINQLSRDSSLNDTMRVEKTVPRHDRVCHYCITYKAPSRPRMPHTNEIASRSRGGYYKTYGKSDLPGTSRMQGYDRRSPAAAALNQTLICTLNIDRSIRGKCVFFAPGIRLRFHHREHCGSRRRQIISIIVTWF